MTTPLCLQGPNYHILAYVIPGQQGEMEPGKRRINWVSVGGEQGRVCSVQSLS